jgi:hypothetical protein
MAAIEVADGGQHKVRALSKAGFTANTLGLMTRIPKGVGHDLEDVREQLAGQALTADGRVINTPKGFVENFARKKLADDPLGLVPDDVLGYYEATDLPFYAYLAENYGYCDRYFCSHPGPTLPNRMYSLTGDVQYDRFGVPILDNNHGDNFLLSRAATIYDLLTRRGVSWRVYESEPSVTMLRMFARYATNTTDIVPIARLEADAASGNLPAFTVVEPAMHHHPEDDDHPDADMYRGQIFVKRVYDALRANPALWQKTLLLITYDEHGGLYDHVVPPIADVLSPGSPGKIDDSLGGSAGGLALRRRDDDTDPGGGGIETEPDPGTGGGVEPDPGGAGGPDPDDGGPEPSTQPQEPIFIPYGVRVPTFVVSPWVKPGKGPSLTLDHCSILKTVLARFGSEAKPFLNDRVHVSRSFDAFLTEAQPRLDVRAPDPLDKLQEEERRVTPGQSQIVTPPLSRKRMREGPVDYHDVSGRLARMLGR